MILDPRGIIYGYGIQTNLSTGVAATAGIPVREDSIIKFDPGHEPISTPLMRGEHGDHADDKKAGVLKPKCSLPMPLALDMLKLFLDQTWAAGGLAPAADYTLQTMANSAIDPAAALSVWKRLTSGTSNDQQLVGMIGNSISISSTASDQESKLDVDCLGQSLAVDQDGSAGVYDISAVDALMHENLTVEIDSAVVATPEINVNINWNLVQHIDNNAVVQSIAVGKLEITGDVRLPWASADFLSDFITTTGSVIVLKWGTAGSADYCEITLPVKWSDPSEMSAGEARLEEKVSFELRITDAQKPTVSLQATAV